MDGTAMGMKWIEAAEKIGAKNALPIALFAIWFLYLAIIATAGLWAYVAVPHMVPLFADLYAILSAADCQNLGYDVFRENPCDVMQRVHVYGSIWLSLGKVGLGRADVLWLGVVIDVLFASLVVRLINPKDHWQFIGSALILLSPATTLAMERCNNDLVIFCLLSCAALLVSSRNSFPYYLGIITSFIAGLLKIYPAATLVAAAPMADSKGRLKATIVIASLLTAAWVLLGANELALLIHIIPHPEGNLAFGGILLFKFLGVKRRIFLFFLLLGLALIALIVAVGLTTALNVKPRVIDAHRPLVSHYYFGLGVTSFTFFATTNYDHRLIFNIFFLPWLFLLRRDTGSNRMVRRMVVVCVGLMIGLMWWEVLAADVSNALSYLFVRAGYGDTTEVARRVMRIAKELLAWSLLTGLATIGMKTLMIQGSYISAMLNRLVGRLRDRGGHHGIAPRPTDG
jgi:hypothetical protein